MTLRQLIGQSGLTKADLDKEIWFYDDEELNNGHREAEIVIDNESGRLMLYPLAASRSDI